MIETTIRICQMPRLIDLAHDQKELAAIILPFLSEHRRDYDIILDLGGYATIEFALGEVILKCSKTQGTTGISMMKFWGIRRFTRQRLEYYAETFARIIAENLHEKPYRPDLKHLDYDL